MPWYVLITKPQQERRAEKNLISQGYTTFLPLINCLKISRGKKIKKAEPLFFRYLFVHLNFKKDNPEGIRYTRGISDFIRFGDQLGIVSDELMDILVARCNSSDGIISELPKNGEKIEILKGPYKHLSAIYDYPDGDQRSFVLIELLQNTVKLPLYNMDFKKVS